MNNFFDEYEREQQERKTRLPALKADLLKALAEANIVQAVITYDGYGDNGQIETIALYDAARNGVEKHQQSHSGSVARSRLTTQT
jgi:hypothetical protein